jgi:hypothetical protein
MARSSFAKDRPGVVHWIVLTRAVRYHAGLSYGNGVSDRERSWPRHAEVRIICYSGFGANRLSSFLNLRHRVLSQSSDTSVEHAPNRKVCLGLYRGRRSGLKRAMNNGLEGRAIPTNQCLSSGRKRRGGTGRERFRAGVAATALLLRACVEQFTGLARSFSPYGVGLVWGALLAPRICATDASRVASHLVPPQRQLARFLELSG